MPPSPESHNTVDELLPALGGRIRAHRVMKNVLRADLAKKAGVSLRTLSTLEEEGRCSSETLIRVLRALDLPAPLDGLVAEPEVSPMALLRSKRMPQRARKRGVQS